VRVAKWGANTAAPVLCRYVPESCNAARFRIFPTCAKTSDSHPTGGPLRFDNERCVRAPAGSDAAALATARVDEGSRKCCMCTERWVSMEGT
jgi:hypothetical protein